ncbi:MAG: T9SS type A sorting domain-containing protein [Bacteroidetes bacterium]|nr:T9SS type A sorting domain-containing protein [Bacteroidota bacterium]
MKLNTKSGYSKTKAITFLAVLLVLSNSVFSQATAWAWAKRGGGTVNDFVSRTIVDASGNVYVAGSFESVSITVGTITVNNGGTSGRDIFIAKYNSAGDVQWVQRITGTMSEYVTGLTSDASGRIYVVGHFISPSISFPPYTAANSNTASPTNDMFVTCINSLGTPQWFNTYGGTGQELPGGCAYSNAVSGLYVVGTFYDPTLSIGAVTLNNSSLTGKAEGFLMRFNSNGSVNWGRVLGSSSCDEYANDVEPDVNGNPNVVGTFQGSITNATTTIGTSTVLTSNGSTDLWLAKYSSAGTFTWARNLGSTSSDFPSNIDVDGSNNVYVAVSGQGAMNFGSFALPNSGGYDGYLAKYNSSGVPQWAVRAYGANNDYAGGVTVDAAGNSYFLGYFDGSTCTVGTSTMSNTFLGTYDLFVAKYNTSGTYQWQAKSTGTANEAPAAAIDVDAIGNVYVGGYVDGMGVFSTNTVTSVGGYDIFLAKIGCLTTGIIAPLTVCTGSSATLTATGATTYSWSTGATSSSIVVSPTASAVYTATGTTGSCVGTPASASITLLPASVSAGSNINLLCKQKAVINATCSPAATSVAWTPTTNLSSSTILTPSVTGNFGTTIYTVNVNLNNGCSKSSTVAVQSGAQAPNICMVTVDSLGNDNEIYWEKTLYPRADSFIVYRETSLNNYTRIGAVSRTAFSMYVDTNRSIGPANGNPNTSYYRYKLQIKDSCGNLSPLSLWHETIFIQDQLNGNFNWNSYAIESTTATPISIYNLKRRTPATGTETLVTSTTGNLATDPAYNTFWPLGVKWFVDAVGFNCNPTAKVLVQKTKTRSNQSNDKLFPTGINSLAIFNENIQVYPNPAKDLINVDLTSLSKEEITVEIKNVLGQSIYQTQSLNQHMVINVSTLQSGVYMLIVKQGNQESIKKVVIQ